MRKKLLKWFTLVEILIVIVIIGILIWALVPRMSAAQWRARDVARKNDLAQLQSAIVTSQQDKWRWPWMTSATEWNAKSWIAIATISGLLQTAWMNSIPKDPLWSNIVEGLWTSSITAGEYWYMVSTRNGTENAWFVLMSKTEVEWGSNRVVCKNATTVNSWKIAPNEDLWKLHLCTSMEKVSTWCQSNTANCTYNEDWELRYILLY